MSEPTPEPQTLEEPWPNQQPIVDGVVPFEDVPQDPDLFGDSLAGILDVEVEA